jgi:glycosyltransferase involved in cell wall biosynthesis
LNKRTVVSIVTPSYNQGKFLEETILSVISQDYPFIEYIIIDGGSSDCSVDIIKKYQDRISYWVSEKDSGQANAINKGWKMSHGEIIAFLNSDDTYQPGIISKVVEAFEKNPDWGMLYGVGALIDAEGKIIEYQIAKPYDIERELYCNSIVQPTVFLRRCVVEKVGWLDETSLIAIDYDYWMRIASLQIPIGFLDGVYMANSRMHAMAKTSMHAIQLLCNDSEFIINRTLNNATFLSATEKIRKRAFAFMYLRKTVILIDSREIWEARKWFIKAIWIDPLIIIKARFKYLFSILLKLLFDERVLSFGRAVKLWVKVRTNSTGI